MWVKDHEQPKPRATQSFTVHTQSYTLMGTMLQTHDTVEPELSEQGRGQDIPSSKLPVTIRLDQRLVSPASFPVS